ncbi:hypothetical protein MIND_00070500 [Mycena indigotica]|uniref:DUF7729 domain-containing protein n=1 Tax=Mycena indigotica TaxID=2126181 RepID=A0A8H6TF49_9AGAR|nr:uncharacterized protein MIND_00070500 [Mycena indigotica]KAF7315552.1 hypothetical protein MIND_00070500 [Mycena indigotica]
MMHRLLPALLAVAAVSAQSLSTTCQNALTSVASNSDANSCLGIGALVTSFLQPNASLVPQVQNMVNTLCSAQPCSNNTLAGIVANITTGCSAELSATGSTDSTSATITNLVQQYYPTVRDIICLKDNSDGSNCLVQTLNNVQATYGTLSINNLGPIAKNLVATRSVPANITCTNCLKEAYNLVNEKFPSTGSSLKSDVDGVCGSSFTDGSTPSNIVKTAAATSGGKNSDMSLNAMPGFGTIGALIGTSLLAMLA